MIRKACTAFAALLFSTAAAAQSGYPPAPGDAATMPDDNPSMRDTLLREQMAKMDTNHDGALSKSEADSRILRDWSRWDINNDGQIDMSEFMAGASATGTMPGGQTGR